MSITLSSYSFDGPYDDPARLTDQPGVFVVLDRRPDAFYVLDVGESAVVKTRIGRHDRRPCWERQCKGKQLEVAVLYTPGMSQGDRTRIEEQLRSIYRPLCA